MNNNELNIGVIGLGKMGLLHASLLNSMTNVKVKAICENNRILNWYAKNLFPGIIFTDNIHYFSKYHLDAVFVSTPIPSHYAVISSLYSIGVNNIFVEKTLAANAEQSTMICELAQKTGGVNLVGYMACHAVTFRKARELLQNGAIGKIISFRGYAYSSDFVGIPEKSSLRGGVIRDLGSHVIDLAFWYFGQLEVKESKLEPKIPINGESSGNIKVNCPDGLNGEFDISWCKKGYRIPEYGLMINGANGSIEVNNDSISLIIDGRKQIWYRADLNDSVTFMIGAPEYYREDIAFISAVRNKSKVEPDFFMASKIDRFIDQIKQKAIQGAI